MVLEQMMPDRTFHQVSFSFAQRDADATAALLQKAKAAGLKARRGAVLRALLTSASEEELFECGIAHARAQLAHPSATPDPIVEHPPVDLPQEVIDRLDRVVSRLARARVIGNRSYLLRALVRATKADGKFIDAFRRYLEANPYKPRGLSKLRLGSARQLP